MPLVYSDDKQKYIIVCYCGAKEPMQWVSSSSVDEKGQKLEWCNVCTATTAYSIPDVYWDGKVESNLADAHGNPAVFTSKRDKARFLKEKGLSEVGDRVRGGTAFDHVFEKKTPDVKAIRQEVRESFQMVRQMGPDRRRAEINKILQRRREQGRKHG